MEAEPEDAAFGRRNVVALKPAGRGFLTVVDFVASSAMDYSGSSGWEKADSSLNEGREDRIGHTVVVTRPKSSSDSSGGSRTASPTEPSGRGASGSSKDRIIVPSESATGLEFLTPCDTCGRTFSRVALDRHSKVCQKVNNLMSKRKVPPDPVKPGLLREMGSLPSTPVLRRRAFKTEDDTRPCPHCSRKFGPKPYDRHVEWCGEKACRLQDSPNKDAVVALAKFHARIAYRPKTPSSSSRKGSQEKESGPTPTGSQPGSGSTLHAPVKRNRSFGGQNSDISYLYRRDHTKETEDIKFIRAATGRGSIRRGPAPTKASVLRMQAKSTTTGGTPRADAVDDGVGGDTRPGSLLQSGAIVGVQQLPAKTVPYYSPNVSRRSGNSLLVVKPQVLRPPSFRSSSLGRHRRDPPEGSSVAEPLDRDEASQVGLIGSYDHSQEYDPYLSAAKQMQELLFGAPLPGEEDLLLSSMPLSSIARDADDDDESGSSSGKSAFQKYHVSDDDGDDEADVVENLAAVAKGSSAALKVARFCHECGGPFSSAAIRFCCDCGVKRLNW